MKLSAYFELTNTNASQLSKQINMAPGYVYEIIKGIKKPSFTFMTKVKEATQGAVTPDDLLLDYEAMQAQSTNQHPTKTHGEAR